MLSMLLKLTEYFLLNETNQNVNLCTFVLLTCSITEFQ